MALLVIDDGGKPLTSADAWRVYDRLYDDDRMTFVAEPPDIDKQFRERATARTASPKLWADAWLLAFAHVAEGVLVTFDKALASRGAHCLLPRKRSSQGALISAKKGGRISLYRRVRKNSRRLVCVSVGETVSV